MQFKFFFWFYKFEKKSNKFCSFSKSIWKFCKLFFNSIFSLKMSTVFSNCLPCLFESSELRSKDMHTGVGMWLNRVKTIDCGCSSESVIWYFICFGHWSSGTRKLCTEQVHFDKLPWSSSIRVPDPILGHDKICRGNDKLFMRRQAVGRNRTVQWAFRQNQFWTTSWLINCDQAKHQRKSN